MRVVEALDEPDHLHAYLGPGAETVASEELALQRGEKALTQRVDRSSPRPNLFEGRFPACRQRCPKATEVYCVHWSEW